jgi:hypothetical protein
LIALELTNSDTDMENIGHLPEIVAANGLESFTFGCRLINDKHRTFFDYICRKYPNLDTFDMANRATELNVLLYKTVEHRCLQSPNLNQ